MPESPPHELLRAAQREIERLSRLVEASKLVNSSIVGEHLYESILTVARDELDVERGTLFLVDSERQVLTARIAPESGVAQIRLAFGQGLAGTAAATGESVILNDAYADPRFDRATDLRSGYRTRSIMCAPIRNRDGIVVGVLQLLNKRNADFGRSDIEFLEALSEHMAIAIENARLHVEMLAKQRMQRELALGRAIQAQLLPDPPTDVTGVAVTARCLSCYEVGGDFYDFLRLPSGKLGIALGDVSGKGVAAALVTSSLQAAVRISASDATDLGQLFERLNGLLHGMTRARKYVTFFFGVYEHTSRTLRYVNAGHLPPTMLDGASLARLEPTGRPLGLFPGGTWREETIAVPPCASLFVFTDGFTEAMNVDEQELGDERWLELLRHHHAAPLDAVCRALFDAVGQFEGDTEPTDDKTLVVLRTSS